MFILITLYNVNVVHEQVNGQFDFGFDLMSEYGNFGGGLPQPPSGYHYETRRDILRKYPRNSYQIMSYGSAKAQGLISNKQGTNNQGDTDGGDEDYNGDTNNEDQQAEADADDKTP